MESKRLVSRTIKKVDDMRIKKVDFKVAENGIKKVDVPNDQKGCQEWNQKG